MVRWGAVRNRQLYFVRLYCKSCMFFFSFNFSIFSIFYTTYHGKKITHIYREKKLHDLTIFLYTKYIFYASGLVGLLKDGHPV